MKKEIDFKSLKIVGCLPASLASAEREEFTQELIGATIIQIGTPEDWNLLEGGGLVVEYQPSQQNEVRRLVLGLNDLGAWVEYQGPATSYPTQA